MANPTTNFGWVMPTSTSLVTNLPADFNTFGQGVDTSMAQLKGGTTGQILSKTSATDMAFTWITNDVGDITAVTAGTGISGGGTSGAVTVSIDTAVTVDKTTAQTLTNKTLTSPALTTPTISTATTNGDLLYGTGSGALTRLGIGSAAQVLTVAAGVPSWATPSAGGSTYSGAYIYNSSATQTLTTGTWTIVTYDSEYYDTNTYHSTATNTGRMTIPAGKTGYYQIKAQAVWVNSTSGYRQLRLQKNGTSVIVSGEAISGTGSQYPGISLNATLYLAAADYIELNAIQTSGGNLDVYRDGQQGFLQIDYLGA